MKVKACVKCGKTKPMSEFHKSARNLTGRHSYCKTCNKENYKKHYIKTKKVRAMVATKKCLYCGQTVKDDEFTFCNVSCAKKALFKNPANHWKWQGKDVSKKGVHKWLHRTIKKPDRCEFCGVTSKKTKDGRTNIEWANKTGKYLRDMSDWLALCTKCHRNYDKAWLNIPRDEKGRFTSSTTLIN